MSASPRGGGDRAGGVLRRPGLVRAEGQGRVDALWKAERVISGVRGTLKSQGLEAPFVGRDRELRQIKDLFHTCAEEKRAQLVSVTGIAGIGKSRLSWEFYKYFDGIAQSVYWHRGRCLAYGEGVTYWALADMVRWRCRIAEDDPAASALEKLQATLAEHLSDPDDGASSSRGSLTCSGWASASRTNGKTCSPPGACSSSVSQTSTRPCSRSRTCSGQTHRCSTSSSTCSSGRATRRCA